MREEQVRLVLNLEKKIEDKPELIKIVEEKGLNAVRPVATIATPATESFWAEKAKNMSKHTLETYIKEFRKTFFGEDSTTDLENLSKDASTGTDLTMIKNSIGIFSRTGTGNNDENQHQQAVTIFDLEGGARNELPLSTSTFGERASVPMFFPMAGAGDTIPHKKIIAMELNPEIVEQLEKLKGQGDWNKLMKQLLQMRAQQLEEQKPEAVTAKSRHIPNKIQRYIFKRTNGTYSYPGCKKPGKIKHHTQRFALEKIHDPDRLHGLCREHERIAHLGLIENEERAPQIWRVKKEPERDAPKFKIDEMVAKYRGY